MSTRIGSGPPGPRVEGYDITYYWTLLIEDVMNRSWDLLRAKLMLYHWAVAPSSVIFCAVEASGPILATVVELLATRSPLEQ